MDQLFQHQEEEVFNKLIEWAEQRESVRAMLLTSTRAVPNASMDFLSDYDVILIVEDIHPYYEDRRWLDPLEVAALMAAYAIPITPTHHAADPDAAVRIAAPLLAEGQRVVLKIHSRDIVHKSDVGGVRVGLSSADDVARAGSEIYAKAKRLRPGRKTACVAS